MVECVSEQLWVNTSDDRFTIWSTGEIILGVVSDDETCFLKINLPGGTDYGGVFIEGESKDFTEGDYIYTVSVPVIAIFSTKKMAEIKVCRELVSTTGTLNCKSSPTGAKVWINDDYYGVTNLTLENVNPGIYDVTFKKDGYEDCTKGVSVSTGETATIFCTLKEIIVTCTQQFRLEDQNGNPLTGILNVDGSNFNVTGNISLILNEGTEYLARATFEGTSMQKAFVACINKIAFIFTVDIPEGFIKMVLGSFEFTDMSAIPITEATKGQEIQANFDVENVGLSSDDFSVIVKIGATEVHNSLFALNIDEVKTDVFTDIFTMGTSDIVLDIYMYHWDSTEGEGSWVVDKTYTKTVYYKAPEFCTQYFRLEDQAGNPLSGTVTVGETDLPVSNSGEANIELQKGLTYKCVASVGSETATSYILACTTTVETYTFEVQQYGDISCKTYDSVTNKELICTIRVDGITIVPQTPHTIMDLTPGTHEITFMHKDYKTEYYDVTVIANSTAEAHVNMTKIVKGCSEEATDSFSLVITPHSKYITLNSAVNALKDKTSSIVNILSSKFNKGDLIGYEFLSVNIYGDEPNHKVILQICYKDLGVSVLVLPLLAIGAVVAFLGIVISLVGWISGWFSTELSGYKGNIEIVNGEKPGCNETYSNYYCFHPGDTVEINWSDVNYTTVPGALISWEIDEYDLDSIQPTSGHANGSLSVEIPTSFTTLPAQMAIVLRSNEAESEATDIKYIIITEKEDCVPEWKCRLPIDGYETDVNNCGVPDRLNSDCIPTEELSGTIDKITHIVTESVFDDEIQFEISVVNTSTEDGYFYVDLRDKEGTFVEKAPSICKQILAGQSTTIYMSSTLATFPQWSLKDVNGQTVTFELTTSTSVGEGIKTVDTMTYDIQEYVEDKECYEHKTQTECVSPCYWWESENKCHAEAEPIECTKHKTQIECEDNNCYWWTSNNTCQNAPEGTTDYLDINIKPYSWYKGKYQEVIDNALALVAKLGGKLVNYMSSITGYEYNGVEIRKDPDENLVIVRVFLKETDEVNLVPPLIVAGLAVVVGAVLVGIGFIVGTSQGEFSAVEVRQLVADIIRNAKIDAYEHAYDIDKAVATNLMECLETIESCDDALTCFDSNSVTPSVENQMQALVAYETVIDATYTGAADIFDNEEYEELSATTLAQLELTIDKLNEATITPEGAACEASNTIDDSLTDLDDIDIEDCVFDIFGECLVTKGAFKTALLIGAGALGLYAYSTTKGLTKK